MSDRPTLKTAADAPAILEALARATWAKAHNGAECPPNRIPTPADMVHDMADDPAALARARPVAEAALLTAASTFTDAESAAHRAAERWLRDFSEPYQPVPDSDWWTRDRWAGFAFLFLTDLVEAVHDVWLATDLRPRHPLAPLVDAWQQRPPPAVWDSREHPVLSGTLAGRTGGLRPLVVANDPRQLPLSLTGGSEPRQLRLGFEQPEPDRVPVLPLVAFDRRGGVSMTSGAGAAHAIRLYVEALLALPPDRRSDGSPIPLRAKLRDVVAGLWPRGWQRGRDWPRLLAGLDELRRLGVEWEHGGTGGVWFAVTVRSMPREDAQLDDLVLFEVQLPPGSGAGPMVSRQHLRLLGLDSAPAYRLYLSLCWLWDHYGTVRGRLIGADPPQRRGKLVEPIKVGDHLVNPAALHRYPALTPDHLAVMSYAPADLGREGSSTRRTQRQRARGALDRIAVQTGAGVVPSPGAAPGSVQVFPPASHKAAHDGKAELWRHLNRDS